MLAARSARRHSMELGNLGVPHRRSPLADVLQFDGNLCEVFSLANELH